LQWHNRYFDGIRTFPENSTCGPVEAVEVRGCKIGILPVNSALFCQGDDDHAQLWIGRRCIDGATESMENLHAALNIALVHHPLEWLHDEERSNVKTTLQSLVDLVLRGHLHETDIEGVAGVMGDALHMAAGAAYQTRKWPNRALYQSFQDGRIDVFPIRYEDKPRPLWTVDPSVFPSESQLNYTKGFGILRLSESAPVPVAPSQAKVPERPAVPRFRSTIPSRRNLPFVGREKLLEEIEIELGDPSSDAVVVLHGQSGVGKSEVAREFARRRRAAYPGGTFIVEAGKQTIVIDLARLGQTMLGLEVELSLNLGDGRGQAAAA
jgi:predicted phosphodiesterase